MPELLVELFAHYGYAVIFVGVLLENAGAPASGHSWLLLNAGSREKEGTITDRSNLASVVC